MVVGCSLIIEQIQFNIELWIHKLDFSQVLLYEAWVNFTCLNELFEPSALAQGEVNELFRFHTIADSTVDLPMNESLF